MDGRLTLATPNNENPLCKIGKALLVVKGLNPQRLNTTSEARVPGIPTWTGMDYQATGLGEERVRIEAITYPYVTGGLDSLAWLIAQHQNQEAVNYIRMRDNYRALVMGQFRIRNLSLDETHLAPVDHLGRKIGVEIDLVKVADGAQSETVYLPTA